MQADLSALGHRNKSHGLKEQLEYKYSALELCQPVGELLELSPSWRAWWVPQFMFSLHIG